MIGVVDHVRNAKEADTWAGVRRAPALGMLREGVPLSELDSLALVNVFLLGCSQSREVLSRNLHLDPTIDLLEPAVLRDAFHERLHHGVKDDRHRFSRANARLRPENFDWAPSWVFLYRYPGISANFYRPIQ